MPTLDCLMPAGTPARTIRTVTVAKFDAWLRAQPQPIAAWLGGSGFEAKAGRSTLLPGPDGAPEAALLILSDPSEPWDFAALRQRLPGGVWRLEDERALDPAQAVLGWALASYGFDRYREQQGKDVRLAVGDHPDIRRARAIAQATYVARDLINTPASDLGPGELADAVASLARRFGATCRTVVGEELLRENYPAIHAVGRASARRPRLVELVWGDAKASKITLVGKGVCFDTGGLDLKPSSNMLLMKKDMGGAAVTLALARTIMALEMPVRLRLLIGAVENSVGGDAFRPGDVLMTRKGLSVEVGNTDAEGRLVLCDLLAEADDEEPDLLIDCATLTGAARVALGTDLPALFTPDDHLGDALIQAGRRVFDPIWRLPLHAPYRELLDSRIADINNAGSSRFAGAITAALFLKEFVTRTRSWAHFDIFAWNPTDRPGRPKGGEATALRALVEGVRSRLAA